MAAGRLFHTQQPTKNMRNRRTMERIGDGTVREVEYHCFGGNSDQ
jgi:hypothetical protein